MGHALGAMPDAPMLSDPGCAMTDDPLSSEHLETARRVLAEARKGHDRLDEERFVEFAADLKEVWEEYEGYLINDTDPKRSS